MKKKAKKRYVVEEWSMDGWMVYSRGCSDWTALFEKPCTRSDAQALADKLNRRGK